MTNAQTTSLYRVTLATDAGETYSSVKATSEEHAAEIARERTGWTEVVEVTRDRNPNDR